MMGRDGFEHTAFHPLGDDVKRPTQMNNPFDYVPDETCRVACREVQERLSSSTPDLVGGETGKMFGVLIVEDDVGKLGYLAAFSGQIGDRFDWPGFVPAVFDYLQPDGYFKREEGEITKINHEIARLEADADYIDAQQRLREVEKTGQEEVAQSAARMRMAKQLRDRRRLEGYLSSKEQEEMIRESQYLKAEVHRAKMRAAEQKAKAEERVKPQRDRIAALKAERRQRSDALQTWLFEQFQMLNANGEQRSLMDIFKDTPMLVPPSGAGECCEPKLLQYAYLHGLRPLQMAMFWWGASPKQEIRHHKNFYPACSGKCKPILEWMLKPTPNSSPRKGGLISPSNRNTTDTPLPQGGAGFLDFSYEDAHLAVVSKPAGMLSVPGKTSEESVLSLMRERWPKADPNTMIVHRLDQATSGLMVVTRTRRAHHDLQRQFARHEVEKTYVALLESESDYDSKENEKFPMKWAKIELFLAPDIMNRPCQKVVGEGGKKAVTEYRFLDENRVELRPLTGRTHQLRVHCAHADGLGRPIKGDTLYGFPADRLYLHATKITFRHPVTGETMTFEQQPDF